MVEMMGYSLRARLREWITGLILTLAVTLCQAAPPTSNLVSVDFEDVDLRIFIKFVSETTGRVFLLDDRVRGQVSVRFTDMIPIDQILEVLESVLELKGFAAIPAGSITKIVPLATAKQHGVEVTGRGSPATGNRR